MSLWLTYLAFASLLLQCTFCQEICVQNGTRCLGNTCKFVSQLPAIFERLQTVGGNSGGEALQQFGFDDGADRTLTKMIVHSGGWIDGIEFYYEDGSVTFHGTRSGEHVSTIQLAPGEHIVKIQGKIGEMNTDERFGPPYCSSGSQYNWQYIMGQMNITTNFGNVFPNQQRDGISRYGSDNGNGCGIGVAGLNTPFVLEGSATGGFIGATSNHSGFPGTQTLSALGWYTRV